MSTALVPHLTPPATKPNLSVVRLPEAWYVACRSKDLKGKGKPLLRTILGVPLAVFRTEAGKPGALLNRCPHRNVPLHLGKVRGDNLQCAYHGWQFDTGGMCRVVPGLSGPAEGRARRVDSYATVEQDGFVWVYMTPGVEPTTTPYRPPCADDDSYMTVRRTVNARGTLHATIENALDVPHTAFLHAGLFRGAGKTNEIEAVVTRTSEMVQAEYIGEPPPKGLAARVLSMGKDGKIQHWDRFILPSIAQVEYKLGDKSHICVTALCTPISDFETALHASISFKLPMPHWLIRPFLEPVAMRIFKQDQRILQEQAETIAAFGGEQYVSTDIDILGGQIWRLMRQAERGEEPDADADPIIKRVTFRA